MKVSILKKVKVGIVGSRRRDTEKDKRLVKNKLLQLIKKYGKSNVVLVSGGCPKGADRFAEELADELGLKIKIFYPDKTKLDPNVPPRFAYAKICYARNELIAKAADILIACVAPDRKGGTENTIKHFLKKSDKLYLV